MKNLEPSDREQLGKAFQKVSFAKGDFIIKQGDKGDNFYILDEGECDISVEGKGSVMTATKGIAFGELALLHNAPRAATVQCTSASCTAWSLDMLSFKTILMGKSQTDSADYEQFLENVPLLSQLSKTDKQTLASSLKEVEYEAGRNIICEGDAGAHRETRLGHSSGPRLLTPRLLNPRSFLTPLLFPFPLCRRQLLPDPLGRGQVHQGGLGRRGLAPPEEGRLLR